MLSCLHTLCNEYNKEAQDGACANRCTLYWCRALRLLDRLAALLAAAALGPLLEGRGFSSLQLSIWHGACDGSRMLLSVSEDYCSPAASHWNVQACDGDAAGLSIDS